MANSLKQRQVRRRTEEKQSALVLGAWVEYTLVALSCAWIILVGVEFVRGETPGTTAALYAIWSIFVVDFAIRFFLATDKADYLRANFLTAISLLLPAFRVFRLARLLRFTRATRLVRVIGSLNRAVRSLGKTLTYRGLPYIAMLTAVVTLLGAAAFTAFERPPEGQIEGYADALWFTAMLMTTMGSAYWPASPEGRILCFLLSFYAFAVFGYFTAALASFFVGDRRQTEESTDTVCQELSDIKSDISELKKMMSQKAD
jgi:voltage-gated potassium channel